MLSNKVACGCEHGAEYDNAIPLHPRSGAATLVLRTEHDAISQVLKVLGLSVARVENRQEVSNQMLEDMLEFLAVFVDKCHHSKEEDVLFPILEAAGIPRQNGPIGCMLDEHEVGRSYIRQMREGLALLKAGNELGQSLFIQNAQSYITLLTSHINKENKVLFVLADNALTANRQDEIANQFEDIEVNKLGVGTHERFHAMIDDWLLQAKEWTAVAV
jgi:hemerythrin-like domain-containing protein